jgi:hypothetical protein
MRESGTVIDKLVLTKDSAYDPSALNGSLGPNESAQVDTATPADLVHYWKLDETSGKTFQDQIGAAPATCTNCPASTTGRVARARDFDGATHEVNVTASSQLNWGAGSRFSIEFWMRASSCGGSRAVLGRHDPATQLHWWAGCQNERAAFALTDRKGGGSSLVLLGTSDVADGNWHHIFAVRDSIAGKNRLFVDGEQQASSTVSYAAGFGSSVALNMGWLNDNAADYHFAGRIDEVAVPDRVLPDSEIRRHYGDGAIGLRRGYEGCGATVRVMPLGDSNTRHWNPGFRPKLYSDLLSASVDIDMVGSVQDGCAPNCAHDPDNEGHSGYTPTDIAANVADWLFQNPADVVMLHIGTNVDPSFPYPEVAQVGLILDLIKANDPNTTVVLARIINKARGSYDTQISVYNQSLETLAQTRISTSDKIMTVDQEPAPTVGHLPPIFQLVAICTRPPLATPKWRGCGSKA